MAKAKTWICRAGVLFMLLLMLGTLISFVVEPIVSDARTRRALGDPDAYVTDTRRSPWISIDPEGRICLYPEKMVGKKTLVIPDAVNGVRVTGLDVSFLHNRPSKIKTIVFPASLLVNGEKMTYFRGWDSLETIVFEEGATDFSKLDILEMPSLREIYIPQSFTALYPYAVRECGESVTVYYAGTEEEWQALGTVASTLSKKCNVVFNTPVPEY